MKRLLLVGLFVLSTLFLVACDDASKVAMPEVKGQEVSMTSQQLDELLTETDFDDADRLTAIMYMNMDMELTLGAGDNSSKTNLKMEVNGKQAVSGEAADLEIIADVSMSMDLKSTLNGEEFMTANSSGKIGLYHSEGNTYANLDMNVKAKAMGIENENDVKSKKYTNASLSSIVDKFTSTIGLSGQAEMSTSFGDIAEMYASGSFKVYQEGERYSLVYALDRATLLEQLESADLSGTSGITFGDLGNSKGEFILIIENGKVIDAGVNISIDLTMTVSSMGATGSGFAKMVLQARYSTNATDYPSLPSDLNTYTYDPSGDLGFSDLE